MWNRRLVSVKKRAGPAQATEDRAQTTGTREPRAGRAGPPSFPRKVPGGLHHGEWAVAGRTRRAAGGMRAGAAPPTALIPQGKVGWGQRLRGGLSGTEAARPPAAHGAQGCAGGPGCCRAGACSRSRAFHSLAAKGATRIQDCLLRAYRGRESPRQVSGSGFPAPSGRVTSAAPETGIWACEASTPLTSAVVSHTLCDALCEVCSVLYSRVWCGVCHLLCVIGRTGVCPVCAGRGAQCVACVCYTVHRWRM